MRAWEQDELHEQISQAALLLKKLLVDPEDCDLRRVCEAWIDDHRSYLPEEAKGYDIRTVDADNLPF